MGFRGVLRAVGVVGMLVAGTLSAAPAGAAALPDLGLVSDGLDNSVGHGRHAFVSFSIENFSSTPPPESGALTITFPAGLTLGPLGVQQQGSSGAAYCVRAGSTATCSLHRVNTFDGRELNVDVAAAASLPIGARPTITARFLPAGGDSDLANNTLRLPVLIRGVAHLKYALSIPTTTLVVGRTVTAEAVITNVGPDPATHDIANVGVLAQPHQFRVSAAGATIFPNGQQIGEFTVGTVPVGASVTLAVRITGLTVVDRATLVVNSGGVDTVDPQPQCDSRGCNAAASEAIRVVTAAAASSTASAAPTTPSAGSGSGALADTGPSVVPLGALALLLLATGLGLGFSGRRGRRS